MNRTASKKGAAGKFLALLASLTMMVAGLVGVAFAAPASAGTGPENNSPETVCAYYAPNYKALDRLNPGDTTGANGGSITYDEGQKSGGWSTTRPVLALVIHAGGGLSEMTFGTNTPSGPGTWATYQNKGLSTITFCYGEATQQPFTYEKQETITKTICQDEETTIVDASAQGLLIKGTLNPTYTPEDKAEFIKDIDADALLSAQEAFGKAYDPFTEGACDAPDVPVYEASLTCSTWSASVEIPMDRDERVVAEKIYDIEVFLDGNLIAQGDLVDGKWSDSGSFDAFADGKAHELVVTLFGEPVKTVNSDVCPTIIITDCTTTNTCGGGETPTYSAPGGSGEFCSATGETVSVKWDGVSGQASQPAANEGAAFNKNNALKANGVPFGTEAGACVKAAAVVAPLAATVTAPSPAKRPVVVSAPKPAKVAGGVAGTVGVPQSATVPAAVPAGDGSQAPGLPMWALALIVAGALGAAAAGKQILGARN